MISVRKFWTIVIITITLSFSLLAYADTFWINADKVKDKDSTEYLIFNGENKVQCGFKVEGLNLASIDKSKNDSIRKEIKENDNLNNFINNLLKLSMTLLGILASIVAVDILLILSWIGFCLYLKLKKH